MFDLIERKENCRCAAAILIGVYRWLVCLAAAVQDRYRATAYYHPVNKTPRLSCADDYPILTRRSHHGFI